MRYLRLGVVGLFWQIFFFGWGRRNWGEERENHDFPLVFYVFHGLIGGGYGGRERENRLPDG